MKHDRSVRTLATGFSFLESPRWHDGRLYVSDFYTSSVYAFTEGGVCEQVCRVPGQPSGLGFSPENELLIASRFDKTLLRRRGGGDLEKVAELGDAPGLLNDMVVDALGRAYVGACVAPADAGNAPATEVLRVEPDGTVSVAASDLVFPNGLVITPDGTLFVAETFAHRISAFDLDGDGGLSGRRVWKDFAAPGSVVSTSRVAPGAPALPDGLALDEEGALWVADAHGSGALRLAPDGAVLETVSTGDASVYALALGGADRRTLFLCTSAPLGVEDPETTRNSALLTCGVDVAGAGLP